jgi:membrane protease YdiL (CAAX protease family)
MVVPLLASLLYFVILSENPISRAIYAGVKVFLVVWPILALKFILRESWPRFSLRDAKHRKAVPLALLVGGIITAVMFIAMATPIGNVVGGSTESIKLKASQLGILKYYVPFALFLSVFHSFLEEYFWRWFVYGHLRRMLKPVAAVVLASVTFASHHVVIATQFFPFAWGVLFGTLIGLGGAAWCIMYEKQDTLAGAWVAHMIVDIGIMAIGYRLLMG